MACNLVTDAPQDSAIQADIFQKVTNCEPLMGYVSLSRDHAILFPFLAFLYNAMAKSSLLRERFVTKEPQSGIQAFVSLFNNLGNRIGEDADSDGSDDADRSRTQEWLTRLSILLMTNFDGDEEDFDRD